MTIDWMAFVTVFLTSIVAAVGIVGLYALGIRLFAMPAPPLPREDGSYEPNGPSRDDEDDDVEMSGRPRWATAGAFVCFGISALVVLFGIYLIVPYFGA